MKNLLYIGNKLNNNKSNKSSIHILGALLEKEGYNLYYASKYNNVVLRMLDMLTACLRYWKRVDYVIIDTYSTWNFYYVFLVSQLCRLLKLKYITRLNGGNLPMRLDKNPKVCQSIFRYANSLVSPSKFLVDAFEKHGYKKVTFIPNSIEISHYPYRSKQYPKAKLLWVRSFSKIYNPTLAVKVLKLLIDTGYETELCMVGPDTGDGSFQETQQLAEKLGVTVTFTGKLTKSEWIILAEEYNLFINTTNYDNMPVSVIEAMALGLPIVSTNVGGMPYLLKDQEEGILLSPNHAESFASAIKKLLENPKQTHAMASRARRKVEKFDWEEIKKLWIQELEYPHAKT